MGGEMATNILLASISTALHLGNGPVTGQADHMENIDKNPTVYVNPSQPLMASVEVGDKEIVSRGEGAGGAGQARLRHQGSLLRAELTFTLQAIKRLSDERYLYTLISQFKQWPHMHG